MVNLSSPASQELAGFETLYLSAFPPEERRPWHQISNPADARGPRMLAVRAADGTAAGFITYWEFDSFIYGEHFAIDPSRRSGGIGSEAIRAFASHFAKPVVIEVEPEDAPDPMAARRIGFYRRNGFELLDYDYVQPPYAPGLPPVPLRLMATDAALNAEEAAKIIHRHVYNQL